ncbi:MAG: 50S ribosomal protein L3 N(5)-glutamine methyltransferase [Ottowia sp.]|nr:50S ribosomal protein L3 N(5)-glutamine methyltransferase [Ottowia sp.]
MPNQHFHTLRDLLRYAVSQFQKEKLVFGHGSAHAYDEAAYLLLHHLHLPLDTLEPFLDATLLPEEIQQLLEIIRRRVCERIPAAYLTKEAWMHGHRFYVDSRVIVPRSFIGELLEEHLSPWIEDPETITHVLDLCTGSGCLAIMAALTFPNAHIDAIDISAPALEVATRNCTDYQLTSRITLHQGDLYKALPSPTRYDIILSNPPYVNSTAMQALPAEYQAEPNIALAGGQDGMDIVRHIVAQAKQYLSEEGILIVEIGNEYENVIAAFPNAPLTWLSTSAGDKQVFLLHAQDM